MTSRGVLLLTHDGISQTAGAWVLDKRYQVTVSASTVLKRKVLGWSDEDALLKPASDLARRGISAEVWRKRIRDLPICTPGNLFTIDELTRATREVYPGAGHSTCNEVVRAFYEGGKADRVPGPAGKKGGQVIRWKMCPPSPLTYSWRTQSNADLRVVSRQFGSPV